MINSATHGPPDRQPETFEQELSLDALTQAFAEVLHGRSATEPPPAESAGGVRSVGAEVPAGSHSGPAGIDRPAIFPISAGSSPATTIPAN